MGKFNIGEIVICVDSNTEKFAKYIGEECIITKIGYFYGNTTREVYPYVVKFSDGLSAAAHEYELKKKEPPKQKTTTWGQCVWKPEGVTS